MSANLETEKMADVYPRIQGLEIEWKQAQLNLSYTQITSPITGIIGDRLKKPGERIQPSFIKQA